MKFVDVNFVTLAILTLRNVRVLETMIVSVDEAGDSLDMIDEKEMMWNRELRETEDEEKKMKRVWRTAEKKNQGIVVSDTMYEWRLNTLLICTSTVFIQST